MRFITILLYFSLSAPAFAGDFFGQPGTAGGQLKSTADAGALATNNLNFGGGGQTASTPASMFAPMSDCQAYFQESVGVVVMNESTTTPISLYHCITEHFASILGGLGVGFQNLSATTMTTLALANALRQSGDIAGSNQLLQEARVNLLSDLKNARQTMMIARDTLVSSLRDGHRTAKSLGVQIAAAPDEGDMVRYLPGGPLNYHVVATPGAPTREPYTPQTDYQPPPSPNPMIDEFHRQEMSK